MILPDALLRDYMEHHGLVVRPLGENAIRPASIDLRLGRLLKVAKYRGYHEHDLIDGGPYWMSQLSFILAATLEWVEIPDMLAGVLAGKSGVARQGLVLENAGYVDPGWKGELTLELFHFSPRPIQLSHGMLIGQLRAEMLLTPAEKPYGSDETSHYQGSRGPVESRMVGGER